MKIEITSKDILKNLKQKYFLILVEEQKVFLNDVKWNGVACHFENKLNNFNFRECEVLE